MALTPARIAALILLALAIAAPVAARDDPGMPVAVEIPIVTTWYNPSLGGVNCSADCSTYGSGQKVEDWHYNASAACITEWRGKEVHILGFGSFICRDSGGAITKTWEIGIGPVIRVDILSKVPIQRGPWPVWWLR